VQPHVPTSVALAQLVNEAPQDVSLGWLSGRLQKRSFGLLMLLLALVGLGARAGNIHQHPAGVSRSPNDPGARDRDSSAFSHHSAYCNPAYCSIGHPNHPAAQAHGGASPPALAHVVPGDETPGPPCRSALAATPMWPFPFSHIIPALVIMLGRHRCEAVFKSRPVPKEHGDLERAQSPSGPHSTPWVYSGVSSQVTGRIALSCPAPSSPKTCLMGPKCADACHAGRPGR
jgi:hypothetical protein